MTGIGAPASSANETTDEEPDSDRIAAESARENQERTAKRRAQWGCLVWIGLLLVLPLVILTAVGSVLVVADRQAAEEAIRRAKDAGDPVTPAEMQAFYGQTPETEAATARWLAVLTAVRLASEDPRVPHMPILGSQMAAATLDERGLYDEATLARAEPFLAGAAANALARAHAARDSATDVRFPLDFTAGFSGDLTHIQDLRTLANLLSLETQVHAARGEMTQATDSLLTLVAASETLSESPDVICYLIRLAIFSVAVDLAMELIDRAEFPPDDLKRLQAAFARQEFHRPMLRAVQGHQQQGLVHFDPDTPSGPGTPTRSGLNDSLRRYPLRGEDQAMHLTLYREFLDGAADGFPAADRAAATADARLAELEDSLLDRLRYAVTIDVRLAFEAMVNAGIRVQAEARVAEACCACERYRQEQGEWPPTLASLVPKYLAAVPLDPVDDRPLRYEVRGEQAIVHSVAHFRPENVPNMRTFETGFASQVLGEPYLSVVEGEGLEEGSE